jgi:ADP-heptose:LPS heptosyltransferase/predicted SAM-dependent methyltransferase
MVWRAEDPQGDEAGKVKYEIVPFTRGVVLDLGCGPLKAFPHFIGVDSCKDSELFGIAITPDIKVDDCADLSGTIQDASVDAVFSSHLLEHIPDYRAALKDWWRCLKVGGYLVLYLPHKAFYPNIGQPGANPDHVHDFAPSDILQAMRGVGGWDLLRREERNGGREYSFLLVFKKSAGAAQTYCHPAKGEKKRHKTACVVRYGGFGDMLQAANILPALKRQGFHVTVMTTPKGQDVLREDPHVDAWYIQDPDQVPNHELSAFWGVVAKQFDRFINLCESVEGTLLALPGRANHLWPHAVRHRHLNHNYLEFTSELAGVPYRSEARFYPSAEERDNATARLSADGPNIVFALAGSSCHKFYPGQDAVIARLLLHFPGCRVFMVGDDACKLLELGWENESRVVRLSGELSIRETLALAKRADIVVGCETGVLNAVAFEDNRKVVLLSHSSHENLTKHWRNTAPLAPPDLDCYPCHRLHYTREFCRADPESGAALCQRLIAPERVFAAIVAEPKVEAAA